MELFGWLHGETRKRPTVVFPFAENTSKMEAKYSLSATRAIVPSQRDIATSQTHGRYMKQSDGWRGWVQWFIAMHNLIMWIAVS